ncbi:hypothetical protein C7S13_6466 [Burkholderia cepacia]|nr:hypothetical protein [Burkholderia cepacia]
MQNKFSSGENAAAREIGADSAIRNALSAAGGRTSFTCVHDTRSAVRRARSGSEAAPALRFVPAEPQASRRTWTN